MRELAQDFNDFASALAARRHDDDIDFRTLRQRVLQDCLARAERARRAECPALCDREECVNDAYVRAWDTIPPNRPNNLFAYLAALCRNAALDVIKKNSAQKRSAQLVELTQEMNECIPDSNITEDMEAILSLHTGRTPEEISEITKTDHYFTAQEAVDFGLADAVKDFSAMLKEGGIA